MTESEIITLLQISSQIFIALLHYNLTTAYFLLSGSSDEDEWTI